MTIDWWTLALQTVNFLVLVWIPARFFFRPVSAIIARRQAEAEKLLADAAATRREADQAKADVATARAAIDAERERLLTEARAEAAKERARLLAAANQAARMTSAEAAAAIEGDRAAMEAGLVDRVRGLAVTIARRLLERLPPGAMLDAFVRSLCDEVPKLPAETRAVFTAATDGAIEVVTAEPLSDAAAGRVRADLERAFATPLALSFRTDPAVIAGIELNSPHAFIRSSWREDLDRIGKVLNLDQKPAG